jgi:hypothetical protein
MKNAILTVWLFIIGNRPENYMMNVLSSTIDVYSISETVPKQNTVENQHLNSFEIRQIIP